MIASFTKYIKRMASPGVLLGATVFMAAISPLAASAQPNGPKIYTNEDYIQSIQKPSELDLSKPKAVFQHVLDSLPNEVQVYPTEGYYYFYFFQNGARYTGNIRLDIEERREGNVLFNFFRATNDWSYDDKNNFVRFGKKDGVIVERLKRLTYKITSGKTSVVFNINDLSNVKPPEGLVSKDETYIGPILDESAVRFFLVFNNKVKIFHYILDETGASTDALFRAKSSDKIYIGRRTGFAYYQDPNADRKILFGVHNRNASVNNYFDGPFDQLPDSFLKGDTLKNAILQVAPDLKGKIDRYGNFDGDARRFLIAPYMYYENQVEFAPVIECVDKKLFPSVYSCFKIPEPDDEAEGKDGPDSKQSDGPKQKGK